VLSENRRVLNSQLSVEREATPVRDHDDFIWASSFSISGIHNWEMSWIRLTGQIHVESGDLAVLEIRVLGNRNLVPSWLLTCED